MVIANAGVCYVWPKVEELRDEDLQGHFVPNVHGFIWLYQAILPLLRISKLSRFIAMGSSAAYLKVCGLHLYTMPHNGRLLNFRVLFLVRNPPDHWP